MMMKHVLVFALMLTLALSFTSCGGNASSSQSTGGQTEADVDKSSNTGSNPLETADQATIDKIAQSDIGWDGADDRDAVHVEIPKGVKEIKSMAYMQAPNLESVVIPDGVVTIGGNAFTQARKLESVKIPDSVTAIEGQAFSGCESLKEIILPKNLTVLGQGAFQNCHSLTSVKIPEGVTVLERNAFAGSKSLVDVVIPKSMTEIHKEAFYRCESLSDESKARILEINPDAQF